MTIDIWTLMVIGTFMMLVSVVSLIACVHVILIAKKYRVQHDEVMKTVREAGQTNEMLVEQLKQLIKTIKA